jgi:hypothetical protein
LLFVWCLLTLFWCRSDSWLKYLVYFKLCTCFWRSAMSVRRPACGIWLCLCMCAKYTHHHVHQESGCLVTSWVYIYISAPPPPTPTNPSARAVATGGPNNCGWLTCRSL